MQLTDQEWEFIGPYLPIGRYGPYPKRLWQRFEGVIWRFKTGGQWGEMPKEYGTWSTVHNRFHQWRDTGVFEALLEDLIADASKRGEVDLSLVSVDSTAVRAHHDAAGIHLDNDVLTALEKAAAVEEKARPNRAEGGPEEQDGRGVDPDPEREARRRVRCRHRLRLKAALPGRSRGGQTSKVHLAADRKCRPLAFVLTAGQAADSPQFIPVLKKVRIRLPVGCPRTRRGSKHRLIVDRHGTPLAVTLTGGNRHDVTQLLPLLDAVPPIRGRRGRPRRKPRRLYADRGYDFDKYRRLQWNRGIKPLIARSGVTHGSGLGTVRWVAERAFAWLHQFKRLRTRHERRADLHQDLLELACSLICLRRLRTSS
ncbi:IS5 family transposase [Streptomyces xanthii]|uniref:IS5 family transposase n=1 Tax=Streptomyces xanthii TaxID=2768069 RepID=A0A7H1BHW9_9ACTN|nr:IS5 family transposase [Streptomyces xanthii]